MPVVIRRVNSKVNDPVLTTRRARNLMNGLFLSGTALIVGSASVRLTGTALEWSWFDVDPSTVEYPGLGLLPTHRLFLDMIMLFGSGLIFFMMMLLRQPIVWWILLMALIPVPVLLWHGWNNPAHMQQGSVWMCSVLGAVAIFHASRFQDCRGLGLAILMAALVPLLIRVLGQITWDIPATIAYFESNRDQVLAMRGLQPDSSAALVLERRLRNAVPTAWFDSTNLLASLMAAGACFWCSVTLRCFKGTFTSGTTGLSAFLMVILSCVVIATGSVGGIVVLIVGVLFLLVCHVLPSLRALHGWLAILLVFLALLAAPASSLLGEFPGSKSLLIRSGYVAGAAEITAGSPLTGVGPAGFQNAWMSVRGPDAPEEIMSPHAMPWDWLAAIGMSASAWILLVLLAVWCSFRHARDLPARGIASGLVKWSVFVSLLIVMSGLLLFQLGELTVLGSSMAIERLIGWLGFVAMAMFLAWLWRHAPMGLSMGSAVAALVLVIHAQTEMTIQQSSTVPWILCVIALATPVACSPKQSRDWWSGMVSGSLSMVLVIIIGIIGLLPAMRSESLVQSAGRLVQEASRSDNGTSFLSGRILAARMLLEGEQLDRDDRIRIIAANQLFSGLTTSLELPEPPDADTIARVRNLTIKTARDVFTRTGSVEAGHLALAALLSRGSVSDLADAKVLAREIAQRDPSGLWSQRHLADVLWQSGDRPSAVGVYQRVLQLDAARSIDPMRQLNDQDRTLIHERITIGTFD